MGDASYWDDLLRRVFEGRKVIVCADVLVGAFATAKSLIGLGIRKPMLVSGAEGTGTLPTPDDADTVVLQTGGSTVMSSIRNFERALLDPSEDLHRALDAYDPDREAIVLGTIFARDGEIFGRRSFGGRPMRWERIEDKLVVDEILDAAGIARAPSEILPVDSSVVQEAFARLDRGLGCAIAADAREGWWGGAEYLRWVRAPGGLSDALTSLASHCERVRMMPFLEGIPCSIHGMVFADRVIAFRPVEMLVLRRAANSLLYAGVATYWDPDDVDREQMREAARKLGSHLRSTVDYRGVFTLDGVMTSEGFRPTEINARPGAGLTPQVAASKVDIALLSRLARDDSIEFRAGELEDHVVASADERRGGSCYTIIAGEPVESETHHVLDRDGTFMLTGDADGADGAFVRGPSPAGGFIRYMPNPEGVRRGPSFATTAVRAFAFADDHFATGLGPLDAARSVR